MQLLVLILKRTEIFDELIHALANKGITGATILDGTGMAEKLVNMEDIPMFGALRSLLAGEEKETCKVLLFAETDEQLEIMHRYDPNGIILSSSRSGATSTSFDDYAESMIRAYESVTLEL